MICFNSIFHSIFLWSLCSRRSVHKKGNHSPIPEARHAEVLYCCKCQVRSRSTLVRSIKGGHRWFFGLRIPEWTGHLFLVPAVGKPKTWLIKLFLHYLRQNLKRFLESEGYVILALTREPVQWVKWARGPHHTRCSPPAPERIPCLQQQQQPQPLNDNNNNNLHQNTTASKATKTITQVIFGFAIQVWCFWNQVSSSGSAMREKKEQLTLFIVFWLPLHFSCCFFGSTATQKEHFGNPATRWLWEWLPNFIALKFHYRNSVQMIWKAYMSSCCWRQRRSLITQQYHWSKNLMQTSSFENQYFLLSSTIQETCSIRGTSLMWWWITLVWRSLNTISSVISMTYWSSKNFGNHYLLQQTVFKKSTRERGHVVSLYNDAFQ